MHRDPSTPLRFAQDDRRSDCSGGRLVTVRTAETTPSISREKSRSAHCRRSTPGGLFACDCGDRQRQRKSDSELRSTNVVIVENENWQRGIGSSIRAGVQGLIDYAPEIDAVVLLVCDQPGVNADTIRNLIKLREEMKKRIVASRYADTLGVPALFDRSLFDELLSLGAEAGAKSIILRNRERVAQLAFPEGAIDIDTSGDWEKLNKANHTERSEEQVAESGSRALSVRIIS
jgi:CTP:molybdopterin cytidylyltransferase MocA